MKEYFILDSDDNRRDIVRLQEDVPGLSIEAVVNDYLNVRITSEGTVVIEYEGETHTFPMFILSDLANIKRCIDDFNSFYFGGKAFIADKSID